MSESYGSILELSKVTLLSKVNLLIITDGKNDIQAIADCLRAAEIDFPYDPVDANCQIENLSRQKKYTAILYDYHHSSDLQTDRSLVEKLQWWCHFYPYAPSILITDALGDERAVKLIQTGVSNYILRNKLYQLPSILEKSLFNFVSQQALIEQQQSLIEQQRKQIQQLQTEVQTHTNNEARQQNIIEQQRQQIQQLQTEVQTHTNNKARQQNIIEQQRKQIQQLQTEVQTWIDDENNKQERLNYISHEFTAPVGNIVGFARALREKYFGDLNKKQMEYVCLIVKDGEHLLKLVKNYLDFTKMNADNQTLHFQKLPVEEICQSSLTNLANFLLEEAREKGLNLDLDLQKDLDFCTVDPTRFRQILTNLLSNAIKFTNEGGVTLRVRRNGDLLYFAVIDTGEGISAENMTKLFQSFPRITHRHDSTGLGLALSKQLARLHGGDITVTSQLGKGSCFTLQIPQYQSLGDRQGGSI